MKIKGKRLTVAQHDLLKVNGFNSAMFLYVKTAVYNEGEENKKKSGQRLMHGNKKSEYLVFINKETGEVIKCKKN